MSSLLAIPLNSSWLCLISSRTPQKLQPDGTRTPRLPCGEDHVELIVSDETEQLDTQALERIASCGPSQKRDGLGLGLSIVRSIISAHGGSIHFSARADKGLEIHIILPLPGGSS